MQKCVLLLQRAFVIMKRWSCDTIQTIHTGVISCFLLSLIHLYGSLWSLRQWNILLKLWHRLLFRMIHHGCCTQLGGPSASSSLRASPGEAVAAVITRRAMVTRTSLTLLLLVLGLGHSTARYYSQFFGDHLPPDNPRQVIISSIIYMSTYLTSQ